MRLLGILFALLVVLVLLGFPRTEQLLAVPSTKGADKEREVTGRHWQYAQGAPFHDVLSLDAQNYTSVDPEEAAERICNELGGEAGFVASPRPESATVGFLCRFDEPDVTMSVDFGDLRRTSRK